jgi:hypothetical protein
VVEEFKAAKSYSFAPDGEDANGRSDVTSEPAFD